MKKKHALVLAGGGSRGSYQIGAWQALRELDWRIDLVTGTSVGALNGAMVVQDDFDQALAMWSRLETGMVLDMDEGSVEQMKTGLFGTIGVFGRELVKRGGAGYTSLQSIVQEFVHEDRVRASSRELGIVTVEMLHLSPRKLFTGEIEPGRLCDYLLASAACFPAFHSYEIDHVKYIDGGYTDNLPIQMALDRGAEEVVAVDLGGIGVGNKALLKAPNVTCVQCGWDLGNFLVFDKASSKRNIRLGYLDTMKAFQVYDGRSFAFVRDTLGVLLHREKAPVRRLLQAAGVDFTSSGRDINQLRRVLLEKNFAHYTGGSLSLENLLLACAESAGRIFELSPLTLYTLSSFQEHLLDEAQGSLEQMRVDFGPDFPNTRRLRPEHFPAFVRHFNSRGIALALTALLQDKLAGCTQADCAPLALLFPKEFAAALFLAISQAPVANHPNHEME